MSEQQREAAAPAVVNAGTMLRAAREAAGLSLDAVAQQLKLAPRQVSAIETGDFAQLPGRTFVRGFVRNYARLVKLDADAVLAALPGGGDGAGLASPTLHATAPSIGELPVSQTSRPAWAKWAIPLTLVAIIAAGAAYEMLRTAAPPRTPAPAATEPREPVIGPKAPEPAPPPASIAPTQTSVPPAAPAALPAPAADPAPGAAAPPPGATTTALPNPVASVPAAAAPGDRELVLSFRDHSWTEVRDRNGRVLLSAMMSPGARQVLLGQAPFELVIGNASDVTLTLDGRAVDLVPHTRQSVARLTLQ